MLERVRIDVKLEVGAMNESVTIEATTPLMQTSSSEPGTTVAKEQIEALPLNGRNFGTDLRPGTWDKDK